MPINYFVGIEDGAPTITVENAEELYEALDLLHTQIMDTCGNDTLLRILSDAMDQVEKARQCTACGGQGRSGSTACGRCGGTGLDASI